MNWGFRITAEGGLWPPYWHPAHLLHSRAIGKESMTTSFSRQMEDAEPEGHVVHLYGQDDQLLVGKVCRYLAEGLKRGDGIVVVATPEHTKAFVQGIRDESGYARAVLEGRLVFMDAEEALSSILVHGEPNWNRFLVTIGDGLRNVQDRGRGYTELRAYGEMVGLLWERREHLAAARLEDYWNRLLEVTGCSLFCAYPIDVFGEDFQISKLDAVLCSHTHLLPVGKHLEAAVSRAMEEVLGARIESLRHLMRPNFRPSWGDIPPAEGLVLWVRNNFQGQADEILGRARQYYLAASE